MKVLFGLILTLVIICQSQETVSAERFFKTDSGTYCPDHQVITTEKQCRESAIAFGLEFGNVWHGVNDWKYCLLQNDNTVYFNSAGDRALATAQNDINRRSLCLNRPIPERFFKSDSATYCPDHQMIKTEKQCRESQIAFGLEFGNVWYGVNDWKYCLLGGDKTVYFNSAGDRARATAQNDINRRSLCLKLACIVSETEATGDEGCDCGGNTCTAAEFCYDGSCNAEAKPTDNMLITNAKYGPECGSNVLDETNNLGKRCNGKLTCLYKIDAIIIGDPCGGVPKSYTVEYTCRNNGQSYTKTVSKEAHTKTIKLECPIEKVTYTSRGKGKCPGGKRVDEDKSGLTALQCRDECEIHHESYYSMWTVNDVSMCGCYSDCDSLIEPDKYVSYEILSDTVTALLLSKDTNLALGDSNLSKCENDLAEKTFYRDQYKSERDTCRTSLTAETQEKSMWKSRFLEVKAVVDKYEASAEEGVAMAQNEMHACGPNSFVKNGLFCLLGFIMHLVYSTVIHGRKNGDTYPPLLEI